MHFIMVTNLHDSHDEEFHKIVLKGPCDLLLSIEETGKGVNSTTICTKAQEILLYDTGYAYNNPECCNTCHTHSDQTHHALHQTWVMIGASETIPQIKEEKQACCHTCSCIGISSCL